MKVTIKTSGGIGGFGLSPKPTTVDVNSLGNDLEQRARSAFAPSRLKSLAKKPGNPRRADGITYEIGVEGDGGEMEWVAVAEDKLSAETIDLIDEIKSKE